MTYVITQRCCNDASCVAVCPVDCIRPTPAQREFTNSEMLYIDPQTCIDCGACVEACPVDAIYADDELTEPLERYLDINAEYFQRHPLDLSIASPERPKRLAGQQRKLRVAIVGAGPAAAYTAQELLARADVEIELFDRLPTPWGLVRSGVAPDHTETKSVATKFESALRREDVQFHLNVEVGKHVTHDDLMQHHHAVVYAVGASTDRHLGIPGEDLPGSYSATEFVSWYNGHPDHADDSYDLSGERAIIVGNGNVALDIARVLALGPKELARTDIAVHALTALGSSNIQEIVLLGRRGPAQAAYTSPEFLALGYLPGVEVVIDERDVVLDDTSAAALQHPNSEPWEQLKVDLAAEYAVRPVAPGRKRIVFRYLVSPVEILGDERVEGVRLSHNRIVDRDGSAHAEPNGTSEDIAASLVLRSIGYRGVEVPGLPFDPDSGTVPHVGGRVEGTVGSYVVGWIKRGPRGVIGTNKVDAKETVAGLLDDFVAGKLTAPHSDRDSLVALLAERQPQRIDGKGWRAIDRTERRLGKAARRPRVKITDTAELIETAKT